jgi:hypothetical protein
MTSMPHRTLLTLIFCGDKLNPWDATEPATLKVGMTEADFSSKNLGPAGAIIISAWISHKDKGALSSANLLGNYIPMEQAQELVKIMRAKENLTTLCGLSREETELDFSCQNLGPGDAALIANDISDMRAVTKLNISENELCAEGGRALAVGLKGKQVMRELNIAGNMLTLNILSPGAYDDMSGVAALANTINGMGALSIANVMGNRIGKEMLSKLQDIMRSKPNLISLCGIADDATEADLSDLNMDADDAILLASELPDKRAVSQFTFRNSLLSGNSQTVTMETSMVEVAFSGKQLSDPGAIMLLAFLPKCT